MEKSRGPDDLGAPVPVYGAPAYGGPPPPEEPDLRRDVYLISYTNKIQAIIGLRLVLDCSLSEAIEILMKTPCVFLRGAYNFDYEPVRQVLVERSWIVELRPSGTPRQ